MTQIIAISGRAHSGKDTVADYLCSTYADTYKEAFAAPLKRVCAEAFGIPLAHFFSSEFKEEKNLLWDISPRVMAQRVGTEMFREIQDRDFWARRMQFLIRGQIPTELGAIYESEDTLVIPDLRFQNEYEMVIANDGIIIHLTRSDIPDTVGIPGHQSENGITPNPLDILKNKYFTITNDSTKENLYEEVEKVLNQATRIQLYKSVLIPR